MKNIYILIDDISNTGGTERVACTLCNQLYTLGYSVFLYSLNFSQNSIKFNLNEGVILKIFSNKNRYISLINIMKHIKNNNGCLLTISMGKLSVDVAFASIFHRPEKIIFSEHISYESFSLFKRKIKKIAYYFANNVVFLTQHDSNLLRDSSKNKNKFSYIRNINPYFNSNTVIKDFTIRKNIAIAVGRLTYQKDFESLISIWKISETKNWELLIIGDGEDLIKLSSMINPRDNIKLIPATTDITSYYNNAKLLLMTSRYEGLPMVLIESQFFGIPSIAYDCKTGPKEIILNNKTGYVIPYGNKKYFSLKLNSLISDQELLYTMHRNSLNIKDSFSPSLIMKEWESIINK